MPRGKIMSTETKTSPIGIPVLNYSLEEGEAGFLLNFPIDRSQLKKRDAYIISFDSPISLPRNPPNTILFEPPAATYTVYGENTFVPKIFVKIRSLHRAQTKTLIRLTIKDIYNTILYMNYITIVCSPESLVKLNASLLPSNNGTNIGGSGGSLIRLDIPEAGTLNIGMTVVGPGIPTDKVYSVLSVVDASTVELDQLISTNAIGYSGLYTFTRSIGCEDPSALSNRDLQPIFTILDYTNNWTYMVGNRIIAKYIVHDKNNNLDMLVLLPIKNSSLLNTTDLSANIPTISVINAAGRVNGDTDCISELTFV